MQKEEEEVALEVAQEVAQEVALEVAQDADVQVVADDDDEPAQKRSRVEAYDDDDDAMDAAVDTPPEVFREQEAPPQQEREEGEEQQQQQQQQEDIIVPRLVFLVPYRDRVQQRAFFQRHMTQTVMAGVMPEGAYQIWFVHQCDARRFNRGAMKNIGVRIAQDLFPDDRWRDITFVFNDVDTMPFTAGFFDYEVPQRGVVKHFFGFTFALGGIVSVLGHDFDLVNGFPNLWAWGYEDNTLQDRCVARGVAIDRSTFYPIMDKSVMQFPDGKTRQLNRGEYDRYMARAVADGLYDVFDIRYHELLPAAEGDGGSDDLETHLLPGVRQFEVTAFSTTVPEPASADDELDFGKVHPYRVPVKSPVFSVFGNMLAAKM